MTAKALVTGYLDAAKTAFATGDPTPLGRVVNGQILSFERAEVVAEAGRAQRREREYRVVSVDAVSDHGVGGVVVTTTIHVDRDEEVTTQGSLVRVVHPPQDAHLSMTFVRLSNGAGAVLVAVCPVPAATAQTPAQGCNPSTDAFPF